MAATVATVLGMALAMLSSPSSLSTRFAKQKVGMTSGIKVGTMSGIKGVTLTNVGTTTMLNVSSITIGGLDATDITNRPEARLSELWRICRALCNSELSPSFRPDLACNRAHM
jgi:hypothetical protein